MTLLPTQGRQLLLAACSAGLSCAAVFGTPLCTPSAVDASPLLAQASAPSQAKKASPYAAPQDETATPAAASATKAIEELSGTKAAGSSKESPFAGAKESDAATSAALRVDRSRLWWLLLPLGLAAISYRVLRTQES